MRYFITITLTLLTVVVALLCLMNNSSGESTIYDPNPNHLWNRLNESLFLRTASDGKKFGLEELDILYWPTTTNLLTGASHQRAITVLDEFINSHGETLIRDPLKRALLQQDLWELFDWSARPFPTEDIHARRELQTRLAVAIHRLALTTNEIASLPDNYAETIRTNSPDLPRGMFETNGDWVNLRDASGELTAPTHVSHFYGHSTFSVMLHVPGGRQAAISYLDELRQFAQFNHVWVYQTNTMAWQSTNEPPEVLGMNPDIPQFPTNAEWALVRRMLTIDANGKIQPTPIVESIQMRRFLAFTPPPVVMETNRNGSVVPVAIPLQKFFEFQMDRRQNNQLREVRETEKDFAFVHFMGKGIDLFEMPFGRLSHSQPSPSSESLQSVTLKTCRECHSGVGIFSVLSYTRSLSLPRLSNDQRDWS